MKKLQEDGLASQRNFSDMRKARGIDVRNERPSSAELEQEHEVPEGSITLEELKGERVRLSMTPISRLLQQSLVPLHLELLRPAPLVRAPLDQR